LMGSNDREPDERPWHPVWLSPFWLTEVPVSWADYCRLRDWRPPPVGFPPDEDAPEDRTAGFLIYGANKIRLQYCEDQTTRARAWHAHAPTGRWGGDGRPVQTSQELFGAPERADAAAPWTYEAKPVIAVSWAEATELGERLSAGAVRYGLPTEAQWEKAARGG